MFVLELLIAPAVVAPSAAITKIADRAMPNRFIPLPPYRPLRRSRVPFAPLVSGLCSKRETTRKVEKTGQLPHSGYAGFGQLAKCGRNLALEELVNLLPGGIAPDRISCSLQNS